MRIVISREDLIHNLTIADSIINTKTPLAMLLNVYLEAQEDGTLILISYNGENGVKIDSLGVVEESGKITILSKKLLETVKRMPGEKVVVRTKTDSGNGNELIIHPENVENPIFY